MKDINRLKVPSKAQIEVDWDVLPVDYSREAHQRIIALMSKKYSIPLKNIKVIPNFIKYNENGEKVDYKSEVIDTIRDPNFQIKLFKEYIELNNIKDVNFDKIIQIDKEINRNIDFDTYTKFKQYEIKWIEWSNFLSYGKDNRVDFTKLKGLVLLEGDPVNFSGKTTFAVDLLHFLLFGTTTKTNRIDKIFNKYLIDETQVIVKGCINIDNELYIIERILTRPKKRTASSKASQEVKYYKLINGEYNSDEPLEDYDINDIKNIQNEQDEHSIKTNKVIKEAIGDEKNFDLAICANSANLFDLIEMGDTEKGRLFNKWIGLLPIEEKDKLAREKYNKQILPSFISKIYNRVTLNQEIDDNKKLIEETKINILSNEKLLKESNEKIAEGEKNKSVLLSSKKDIDEVLLKLDIITENKKLENIKTEGSNKRAQLGVLNSEIEKYKSLNDNSDIIKKENDNLLNIYIKVNDITHKINNTTSEYINKITNNTNDYNNKINDVKNQLKNDINLLKKDYEILINENKSKLSLLKKENEDLIALGDSCPTCKQPYNNTPKINSNENEIKLLEYKIAELYKEYDAKNKILNDNNNIEVKKLEDNKNNIINKLDIEKTNLINELLKEKTLLNKTLNILKNKIELLEIDQENFKKCEKDLILAEKIKVDIDSLLSKYKEIIRLLKDYESNKDSIDKNNQLDISINNINIRIKTETDYKENIIKIIQTYNNNIISYNKEIDLCNIRIEKIKEEDILDRSWKIYLELVGKSGISKLILKGILPIINSELHALLEGVVNFDAEININDKNDLIFNVVDSETKIVSDLSGCSGFEKTISSIALRMIISNLSVMPRPQFIVLDEILSAVGIDNLDKVKGIYDKMLLNYSFILHIAHIPEIGNWHNQTVLIKRDKKNISHIEVLGARLKN
jgi:hypothetical protein